jgi:hypothetical protein
VGLACRCRMKGGGALIRGMSEDVGIGVMRVDVGMQCWSRLELGQSNAWFITTIQLMTIL